MDTDKITLFNISVQEKDKNRCNVYIDGEYSFSLSLEIVMKYHLKKGAEIDEKELNLIKEEDEFSYAVKRALNYIAKSLKTKKEVKTYLIGKGFSENAVKYATEKLISYGYIDDYNYAKQYLENCKKTQGDRLSDYKLMAKGISKEIIGKVREEVDNNQYENAKALAEKKLKNKEKSKENILKTYRYLIGRGFSYEEAEYAVSFFKEDK
ncbi:MAG: RecX family transcriptional regulator [Clostridia bacterium]|nr:RecX family transcriptional regulator [Clostridia bacterium]